MMSQKVMKQSVADVIDKLIVMEGIDQQPELSLD